MTAKRRLHKKQKRAIGNVWNHGLSGIQAQVIDALDMYSRVNPESPSIYEIVNMTGLSYGTVWNSLAVLEHFGYIDICRDCKGRMYWRGIIVNYGFDLSEDYDDE